MSEADSPDSSKTEEEGTDEESDTQQDKPNKLTLEAGKLTVKAESVDESVQSLANICSAEMESMMRYHIRGELEMIEEDDLHSILLGGD